MHSLDGSADELLWYSIAQAHHEDIENMAPVQPENSKLIVKFA